MGRGGVNLNITIQDRPRHTILSNRNIHVGLSHLNYNNSCIIISTAFSCSKLRDTKKLFFPSSPPLTPPPPLTGRTTSRGIFFAASLTSVEMMQGAGLDLPPDRYLSPPVKSKRKILIARGEGEGLQVPPPRANTHLRQYKCTLICRFKRL